LAAANDPPTLVAVRLLVPTRLHLRWATCTLAGLLVATTAVATACATPSAIDWRVEFADGRAPADVSLVRGEVRSGGCEGEVRFATEVRRGEGEGLSPGALPPGRYGFRAEATTADCQVIAEGCVEVTLPADAPVVVTLEAIPARAACPASSCTDGVCANADMGADASAPDAGERDAAVDAATADAGERDAAVDMGPVACGEALLASGATYQYVLNVMRVAGPEGAETPFASAGFNLDGDDVVACNSHIVGETAEFLSVTDPTERGIDNALGGDLGNLSNISLQSSVDNGSRVLLLTVRGVDSFESDDCIEVVLSNGYYAGSSLPLQDPDGRLAPDQEFFAVEDIICVTATISGGVARVRAPRLPIGLPFIGGSLAWPVTNAIAEFAVQPEVVSTGVITGVVNTREMVTSINSIPDLATYATVIEDTLTALADIDQNGSPESCEAGSLAFAMSGVRARIF